MERTSRIRAGSFFVAFAKCRWSRSSRRWPGSCGRGSVESRSGLESERSACHTASPSLDATPHCAGFVRSRSSRGVTRRCGWMAAPPRGAGPIRAPRSSPFSEAVFGSVGHGPGRHAAGLSGWHCHHTIRCGAPTDMGACGQGVWPCRKRRSPVGRVAIRPLGCWYRCRTIIVSFERSRMALLQDGSVSALFVGVSSAQYCILK